MSDVFLYFLFSNFLEHNIDLNKYFDNFHCKSFQKFVLVKYHFHNHPYIYFRNLMLYICQKTFTMMYKVKIYLFVEDKRYNSSVTSTNRDFV